VDDIVDACLYFFNNDIKSGIYNVGTGVARSYNDLAKSVFTSMKIDVNIEYIDTPEEIRNNYQYFTQAEMNKLFSTGYLKRFIDLEAGVDKYIYFLNREK
jgi:ADP-L-glycero-D-manno-heptose 6-epimerase